MSAIATSPKSQQVEPHDPVARELIAEAVAGGQPDPAHDDAFVAVIGTMPMSTLAAFGGMSIDHDTLDKLAESTGAIAPVGPDRTRAVPVARSAGTARSLTKEQP